MLHRNDSAIKSVESVLKPEESLWWERTVKEVGLSRQWKNEGVMDGESGKLTQWEDVVGAGKSESETEKLGRVWRGEVGSWFQRHGEEYRKERSIIRSEDDVGGRVKVTRDQERVLREGWTEMRWWRYGGCVVVRTLTTAYAREFWTFGRGLSEI